MNEQRWCPIEGCDGLVSNSKYGVCRFHDRVMVAVDYYAWMQRERAEVAKVMPKLYVPRGAKLK